MKAFLSSKERLKKRFVDIAVTKNFSNDLLIDSGQKCIFIYKLSYLQIGCRDPSLGWK
jgi:hypothetical protein